MCHVALTTACTRTCAMALRHREGGIAQRATPWRTQLATPLPDAAGSSVRRHVGNYAEKIVLE